MLWFILLAIAVVGLFTANRVLFAAAFMVLFLSVGIQRTMTDFELPVGYDFVGTEVFVTTESCGQAVPLLLNTDGRQDQLPPGMRRDCLKTGRTRVVEAVLAVVVGLGGAAIGWRLIPALAPTPIDEVLNPLPRSDRASSDDADAPR